MNTKFKKLTPDLMVEDVKQSINFYVDKLGFLLDMAVPENEQVIETILSSDKNYVYAMVHRDEVFIMLMRRDVYSVDVTALSGLPIGASVSLYIDVDDIDSIYADLNGKVEIIKDISTTWYGMTEFYIRDNNGYILCFAGEKK